MPYGKHVKNLVCLNPFLIREVFLTKAEVEVTAEDGLNPFLIREVFLTAVTAATASYKLES